MQMALASTSKRSCRWFSTNSAKHVETRRPNAGLIEALSKSREAEASRPDKNAFKLRSFDKAIQSISALEYQITSAAVAKQVSTRDVSDVVIPNQLLVIPKIVKGVGNGIARRIDEYLKMEGMLEGTMSRADLDAHKRRQKALAELQRVSGLGPTKATRLYEQGCSSLEDLRKPNFRSQLSRASQIALDFLDDLEQKVTREEVERVSEIILTLLEPEIQIFLTGSYRRGVTMASAIDILVIDPHMVPTPPSSKVTSKKSKTSPENQQSNWLNQSVVEPLESAGVIASTLSSTGSKWQGLVRIPSIGESVDGRLDGIQRHDGKFSKLTIHTVPYSSQGAALLFYTGDTEFIRHIRREASKLGFQLNEFGLWRSASDSEERPWTPEPLYSENDILREIGLDFVDPTHRNFSNITSKAKR
ncbi:Nucleotidyltransferase [Sistotremastrum suecicum HHB10207 ss-3]|uniref:DNA polymerase n=1 Tax=Sistotremastrum suecicum HHB10207 ss-3 TaxID=1314776 RepID=A0A166J761_9AGAM|nr:Nucleotidyltransferase [Sistotremastrum suecicum HHB10207 ss-3]